MKAEQAADLLKIYQEATNDDPAGLDGEQRCLIAEEMQAVIDAPTEAEAVKVIGWWGLDSIHGEGHTLGIVRKVRGLAEGRG